MNHIFIDGKIQKKENVKISPFIDGVLYGKGFFETIRADKGHVYYLDEHIARLKKSLMCFKLKLPKYSFKSVIEKLLKKNELEKNTARIKIIYLADKVLLITTEKQKSIKYQKGLIVGVKNNIYESPYAQFKSTAYFYYKHLYEQAQKNKFDAYLLQNSKNELIEAVHGNIMLVKNDEYIFPKYEENRLLGITESVLVKKLNKVKYKKIKLENINDGNLFMLNSMIGAVPIRKIESCKLNVDSMLNNFLNDLIFAK
ncbi:aminotransferase class IV [bacterium]